MDVDRVWRRQDRRHACRAVGLLGRSAVLGPRLLARAKEECGRNGSPAKQIQIQAP
jgi:hypothetical protein